MDFIFDCFFEEILGTIERSGLKTRRNRQNVIDQLDSIISGCCAGQNVPPEEASRLAVESAIKYHQTIKTGNAEVCRMGKYHNVLYIAMKVSWNWGVKDSTVVCALLNEIYDCEKTFERLFLGAIFGTNAPYFIAGWRSDFKDQDENARAAVYFLHHACQQRLKYRIKEHYIPFIDVPVESCGMASPLRVALQATAPDVLLILLRHGANPVPFDGGISPVLAILDKLMEYEDKVYPYQLCACLNLLLLAIPFIELPYKPLVFEVRKEMFIKKYSVLIGNQHLIKPNQVFGVSQLKHLCRCSIRGYLRENCQLPNGIKELRIPGSLKRYVDLLNE